MYVVFWLTFLGALVFLLAWVISWSTRLKTLVGRRMWPFLTFILTLLVVLPPIGLGYYIWDENIEPTWLFGYALSLALIYMVLGVFLMFRGLRHAAVNPRGRTWSRRGLLLTTCLFVVLSFGSFFIINHTVKARLEKIAEQSTSEARELLPKPIPDKENAFVLYKKASDAFEKGEKPPVWFTKDYGKADPTSPEVAALVAAHASELELVRQAGTLPGYYQEIQVDNLIASPIPAFSPARSLTKLLSLSARAKAGQGDIKGAAEDWMTIGRMANQIGSFPMLFNVMIGMAFNDERMTTLEELLQIAPDFPDQLPQERLLDDEVFVNRFVQGIRMEDMALNQAIAKAGLSSQLTAEMDVPVGALAPVTSALWRVFLLPADLDGLDVQFDDLVNTLSKPLPEVLSELDKSDKQDRPVKGGILTAIATPNYSNYVRRVGRGQAVVRLMRLALASASYYKDKGQYPASQADLAPGYLKDKLIDPFTGKELNMKPVAEGLALTSQGAPPAFEGDRNGGPVVFHLKLSKQ